MAPQIRSQQQQIAPGGQNAFNTDEDSNMSQIAKEFFMNTHGDKAGGSFDLLQNEIKEEEDEVSNESQQQDFENESSEFSSSRYIELLSPIKRLNTDFQVYSQNYTKIPLNASR